MRTISSLPPELTRLLFDAGTRIIVLVEGDDDRYVLREWFSGSLSEVEFYDCGGISNLNKWLEDLLSLGTRYALENYLLEPQPLWEVLTMRHPAIRAGLPDKQAMETRLIEICRMLKSVTAANLAYFDENKAQYQSSGQTAKLEYLSVGHHHDRQVVIQQAAKQLKCSEDECERRIAEREEIINRHLANLNLSHQVIDGKRILHWINHDLFITGRDYLFRLLSDRAKLHDLPDDVVKIVKDRILSSART